MRAANAAHKLHFNFATFLATAYKSTACAEKGAEHKKKIKTKKQKKWKNERVPP